MLIMSLFKNSPLFDVGCRIWVVSMQILTLELAAAGTSTSCTRLREVSMDEATLMNTSSQVC